MSLDSKLAESIDFGLNDQIDHRILTNPATSQSGPREKQDA